VWFEFQEAAVHGAAAIAAGHVPPINPTEPPRQHVFVFNSTFFSFGVDSKDAYKVTKCHTPHTTAAFTELCTSSERCSGKQSRARVSFFLNDE